MTVMNKFETIAWEFLKRNSEYDTDYALKGHLSNEIANNIFDHYLVQNQVDLLALKWGLFSYKDPIQQVGPEAPFWAITPTLDAEAIPNKENPLLPMLRKVGAAVSGLLLLNGNLIIKIEHENHTVQLRIRNGRSFDEVSGIILHLPLDLKLSIKLSRSMDLWNIASNSPLKKLKIWVKQIMLNYSLFSMVSLPESAIAK